MKPCQPGRVRCEVPGCGRTFKLNPPYVRVICGKHWRAIPPWMRWRMKKLRRLVTGLYMTPQYGKADRLAGEWWDKCRDRAIEIAMGITA